MSLSSLWGGIKVIAARSVATPVRALTLAITLTSVFSAVVSNPVASGILAVLNHVLDVVELDAKRGSLPGIPDATIDLSSP